MNKRSRGLKVWMAVTLSAALMLSAIQTPSTYAAASNEHLNGLTTVLQPIVDAAKEHGVGVSVSIKDLSGTYGNETIELGSEDTYYSASIIKLMLITTLMQEVDAGKYSLDKTLTVKPEDVVGGAGSLQNEKFPQDITIGRLAKLMITQSDNTATNVLIGLVGFDKVNAFIKSQGFTATHLGRKMMTPAKSPAEDNYTNANEMLLLLDRIYKAEVVSSKSRDQIVEWMKAQEVNSKFGAVLKGKPIAHKTGELGDVSHDVGYFLIPGREIAITVLTKVLKPEDAGKSQELNNPYVQRIAKAAYNYLADHPTSSPSTASVWPAMSLAVAPIVDAAEREGIRVSVGIKDLSGQADGAKVLLGSQQSYMPASTIKMALVSALMQQVDKGALTLDQKVTVKPEDVVGGTGSLQKESFPQDVTLERLARLMIIQSDNTATNVLIDVVGLDKVQALMNQLGMKTMHLGRKMFAAAPTPEQDNYIDAADLVTLLDKIYKHEFLSTQSSQQIIEWMKAQEVNTKFGAALPDAPIAHKTGENANVTHDVGYFLVPGKEIAISVMTEVTTTGDFNEAQAIGNPIVQSVAKAVYNVLTDNEKFTDVKPGHWAESLIGEAVAANVVKGTTDSAFEPERNITRAEFVALLVRSLGLTASSETQPFADVPSHAWYATDVAAAQAAGIALGSDGAFRPNASISRAEVVSLITRAYEYKHGLLAMDSSTSSFRDSKSIPSWASEAVTKAGSLQLVNGYPDGTFRPESPATRAEAVKIIVGLRLQL